MNKPDLTNYLKDCAEASGDLWAFRQRAGIRGVTDTNTYAHGYGCVQYFNQFALQFSDLTPFKKLDSIGQPPLHDFGHIGIFNPTTLRHVTTAFRIALSWDYWSPPFNLVEIGVGYGALCAAMNIMMRDNEYLTYTLIDLPEPLKLAQSYLMALNMEKRATFRRANDRRWLGENPDYVISCYALSELDKAEQDWYLENVILKARGAFLVMNTCVEGYTRQEWLEKLPGAMIEPEIPATHKDNYTLTWRRDV